ncbi:MAG: methyltransferase, TIGR04325 family [Gemmatimonadota bacterium]
MLNWLRTLIRPVFRIVLDVQRYVSFPPGGFRGVYQTFDEALAHAPRGKKTGYDHAELAAEYRDRFEPVLQTYDYPVLFHLSRLLPAGGTVLDMGGNVGTHFLTYRKWLDLDRARWIVLEVPRIAAEGRALCDGMPAVSFISELGELDARAVDVLLSSGMLQNARPALNEFLEWMDLEDKRPAILILNRLPLYDGEEYVTLQNGGLVCYPQHVFNRTAFIASVTKRGYQLVDHWDDLADSCIVPFHRDRWVHRYSGLCFVRVS